MKEIFIRINWIFVWFYKKNNIKTKPKKNCDSDSVQMFNKLKLKNNTHGIPGGPKYKI